MAEQSDEDKHLVSVSFKEEEFEFSLEDAKDDSTLKECFDLAEQPKFLLEGKRMVKLCNIKAGSSYKLPNKFEKEVPIHNKSEPIGADVEQVKNALYCSKAVYNENPVAFLNKMEIKLLHSIDSAIVSKFGPQKILLAISETKKTLYVAYRGSKTVQDWKTNINLALQNKSCYPGKCHNGFMDRAEEIPVTYFLDFANEHCLENIVTCGHSLGGAVSAVTALNLLHLTQDSNRSHDEDNGPFPDIFNITFGAPYFGNIDLQEYCQKIGYISRFTHFTNQHDIVPTVLSLSQTMADLRRKVGLGDNPLPKFSHYISKLAPLMEFILAPSTPEVKAIREFMPLFKEVFGPGRPVSLECSLNDKDDYVPIGSYRLITTRDIILLEDKGVVKNILQVAPITESTFCQLFEAHTLDKYESELHAKLDFKPSPANRHRNIGNLQNFCFPKITQSNFVHTRGGRELNKNSLMCSLTITGTHIWPIMMPQVQDNETKFFTGYSFGENPETTEILKAYVENGYESITIKQQMKENDELNVGLSVQMKMSTPFSTVEFTLNKEDMDTIEVTSYLQMIKSDKVAHVVRQAIQRGIVLGKLNTNQQFLTEVKEHLVDKICIEENKNLYYKLLEPEWAKRFFEDETTFYQVSKVWEEIEDFCSKTLSLKSNEGNLKKWFDRSSLGAKMKEAKSVVYDVFTSINDFFDRMLARTEIIEEGYIQGLQVLIRIMMRETDKSVRKLHDGLNDSFRSEGKQAGNIVLKIRALEKLKARVQSLIDLRTTYSLEEAMENLWIHHEECIIAKYDADSKKQITDRVNCILSIHELRALLAHQCFIGFGATSIEHHARAFSNCGSMNNLIFYLLKDTGDIDIQTKMQIHKARDIMGCTGDAKIVFCINQAATLLRDREEELGKVDVMKRTKAHYIRKIFETDASKQTACYSEGSPPCMSIALANFGIGRSSSRRSSLSSQETQNANSDTQLSITKEQSSEYESSNSILEENLLFTDWNPEKHSNVTTEDASRAGICSVKDIKDIIRDFLVSQKIYENDPEGFKKCFDPIK